MTPEEWDRLRRPFDEAVELPRELRGPFVDALALKESERKHLHSLLEMHEGGSHTFDGAVVRLADLMQASGLTYAPGDVALERFRIVRLLGSGGMGEVYEAQDGEAGRIALKTIRSDIAGDPQMLSRFRHEVQLARKVGGPNVCRIHELFHDPAKQTYFLTMEFLSGQTLADRIREGQLPLDEVERIAQQCCAGLSAIHQAGVVHRDFKSRNVMLSERNGAPQAVITDFGLARGEEPGQKGDENTMTRAGTVMGTPEYMAPEQFEGRRATASADIYAFGVVLYQMLTGKSPFSASSPMAAAVLRAKRPPRAASIRHGLPKCWDRVIDKCLQYEPSARFQSASAVAEALRGSTFSFPVKLPRLVTRPPGFGMGVAAAIVLTCAAAWYLSSFREHKQSLEAQRWYADGTTALREGTYFKAANMLGRAAELDKRFVLAHARLADAWNELDVLARSTNEMLLATSPELSGRLSELDRLYVAAVHATITGDYPAAVQHYREILDRLPKSRKAEGFVDLGRAYEKAGNIPEAIRCYTSAAALHPEMPAPSVRLGVLLNRQRKTSDAAAAFSRAETLYRAAINVEGTAEIDYQRGYSANNHGQPASARQFLLKSLGEARAVGSPHLEVRVLAQLCVAENLSENFDKAKEFAEQAIQTARANGIEYWAADALVRLGGVYTRTRDFDKAEAAFQEARQFGEKGERPRIVALAQSSLANLRNTQGRPYEVIPFAAPALAFYQKQKFYTEAAQNLLLIGRAKRDQGDWKGATDIAASAVSEARKTNEPRPIVQAEEFAGSIALRSQDYPVALTHFEAAHAISRDAELTELAVEKLNCADTLWRLGRYTDAENTLQSLPERAKEQLSMRVRSERIRAEMLLSENHVAEARAIVRRVLSDSAIKTTSSFSDLLLLSAKVELLAGSRKSAEQAVEELQSDAKSKGDLTRIADVNLMLAEIDLSSGKLASAKGNAESACDLFFTRGQQESKLRNLMLLALIYRRMGDTASLAKTEPKKLDILSALEHNWGTQMYIAFLSRPDLRSARPVRIANGGEKRLR